MQESQYDSEGIVEEGVLDGNEVEDYKKLCMVIKDATFNGIILTAFEIKVPLKEISYVLHAARGQRHHHTLVHVCCSLIKSYPHL